MENIVWEIKESRSLQSVVKGIAALTKASILSRRGGMAAYDIPLRAQTARSVMKYNRAGHGGVWRFCRHTDTGPYSESL
jgi:hypothetical protein